MTYKFTFITQYCVSVTEIIGQRRVKFSLHQPEKWGIQSLYGTPHPKKWGVRVPPVNYTSAYVTYVNVNLQDKLSF